MDQSLKNGCSIKFKKYKIVEVFGGLKWTLLVLFHVLTVSF